MVYSLRPMTHDEALLIAKWHYPAPYEFYDMSADQADLVEFLDFDGWEKDEHFVALDEAKALAGFFSFEHRATEITVGLGMHPDLTGRHLGQQFCLDGLCFAKRTFEPETFRLAVATFNHRAINVYTEIGFQPVCTVLNQTNGGTYEFVEMIIAASELLR